MLLCAPSLEVVWEFSGTRQTFETTELLSLSRKYEKLDIALLCTMPDKVFLSEFHGNQIFFVSGLHEACLLISPYCHRVKGKNIKRELFKLQHIKGKDACLICHP